MTYLNKKLSGIVFYAVTLNLALSVGLFGEDIASKTQISVEPPLIELNDFPYNPVLIPDALNLWERRGVSDACVIKDDGEPGYRYRMWVSGSGDIFDPHYLKEIGYAFSKDGIHWIRAYPTQPVLTFGKPGDFDYIRAYRPCVIWDGDTLKMWYTGWGEEFIEHKDGMLEETKERIGYAVSKDGRSWFKQKGPLVGGSVLDVGDSEALDSRYVKCGTVIKKNKGYMMWYEGGDGKTTRIFTATSKDGLVWVKNGPIDGLGDMSEGLINPVVADKEGRFYLWAGGLKNKGKADFLEAVSIDGHIWKITRFLSVTPSERMYDTRKTSPGCAFFENNMLKMWFNAVKNKVSVSPPANILMENASVICYEEEK